MTSEDLERIAAIGDRAMRLRAATEGVAKAQHAMTELSRLRKALVQELHDEGWTYAQIAEAAGLSRGRVHQVRHQGPAPEGAFFGSGPLTIVTPLKVEERGARPVVAVEDVTASQRIGELARELGFECGYEQIPLSGEIDLNRPGLVVICGPRISSDVQAVLASDPVLRFVKYRGAWSLKDATTGTRYRSGEEEAVRPSFDVAYLARLPRPDGQGTLLIFTGIHPPGTLGVVDFLVSDLADLHRESGGESFSLLLGVEFDPKSHEPQKVKRLTPVYRHSRGG